MHHQGTVNVYSQGELIEKLRKRDYFGQVALMKAGVRTASCQARTTCEVSVLSGADMREVRQHRGRHPMLVFLSIRGQDAKRCIVNNKPS